MPGSSRVAVAKVAAAVLTSSWAALIAAAPASADVNSECASLPAEDLCHLIWNVPADPSIPHYPRDRFPEDPFPSDNSNDLSNPMNPNSILSPLNPMNPSNPSNPANPSSPLNPANQPHS